MRVIRLLAGLLGVAALGAALACEKVGIEGNNCRANGADIVIDTRDAGAFEPQSIQVQVGQEVCWQNLGTVSHTITADEPDDSIDVVLPPTFIYSHGFGIIRDFNYHCTTHGESGVVKVR
jgi:plastocyanin